MAVLKQLVIDSLAGKIFLDIFIPDNVGVMTHDKGAVGCACSQGYGAVFIFYVENQALEK